LRRGLPWATGALLFEAAEELESRDQRIKEAERLLEDISGAMSLQSVRRGVAMMEDVVQMDWVFRTLKEIREYLDRHG